MIVVFIQMGKQAGSSVLKVPLCVKWDYKAAPGSVAYQCCENMRSSVRRESTWTVIKQAFRTFVTLWCHSYTAVGHAPRTAHLLSLSSLSVSFLSWNLPYVLIWSLLETFSQSEDELRASSLLIRIFLWQSKGKSIGFIIVLYSTPSHFKSNVAKDL